MTRYANLYVKQRNLRRVSRKKCRDLKQKFYILFMLEKQIKTQVFFK